VQLQPPTPVVIADIWTKLRERGPRVHCITNSVEQAFTANVLLAAGAIPSMSTDPGEISHFVHFCDSLLVNLGTLDAPRQQAIAIAIDVATTARKRWLLDPVFIEVTVNRLETAKQLLLRRPTIVRPRICFSLEFTPHLDRPIQNWSYGRAIFCEALE
jgi:hydroxyethylthiazole kinase